MQLSSVHNIHNSSRFFIAFLESQRVLNPLRLKAYVTARSAVFISVYAECNLYGVKCGVFPTFTFESTVHLDSEVNEVRGSNLVNFVNSRIIYSVPQVSRFQVALIGPVWFTVKVCTYSILEKCVKKSCQWLLGGSAIW